MGRKDSVVSSLYLEDGIAKQSDGHAVQFHIPLGIVLKSWSDLEDDAGL